MFVDVKKKKCKCDILRKVIDLDYFFSIVKISYWCPLVSFRYLYIYFLYSVSRWFLISYFEVGINGFFFKSLKKTTKNYTLQNVKLTFI